MKDLEEALLLSVPPKLEGVHAVILRVLAWCRLHTVPEATRERIELPLVEALNNAIEHGCDGKIDAFVQVTLRVTPEAVIAEVSDPGHFAPGANWIELPEDPFAEGGRGGHLIHTGSDGFEHTNRVDGHSLTLRWNTRSGANSGLLVAAESENYIDRLTADLANSFETVLGLTHFAGLLATSATFAQLLEKVNERLRMMVEHEHLIIRFIEGESLVLYPVGRLPAIPAILPLNRMSTEGICVLERHAMVGLTDSIVLPDAPLGDFSEKLCLMIIEFGGQTLGTMAITRGGTAPAFSGGEVELLQAVADFVGIARATDNLWQERHRRLRMEQEIEVAAGIQRSLLPSAFPSHGLWRIHGACRPAREVGGDYFDVVTCADGSVLLLIADVMGKGVPASLLATMLRSSLRAMAAHETAPDHILTGINRQLFTDLEKLGMFITAVLVHLPAEKGVNPRFANAGHCPPAIIKVDGTVYEPIGGDVPLGVLPDTLYQPHPCPLAPGESLFLYTDGCYELTRPDGEMLGVDRYLSFAASHRKLPPVDFINALLDHNGLGLDFSTVSDDRTLVVATLRS